MTLDSRPERCLMRMILSLLETTTKSIFHVGISDPNNKVS